MRIILGILICAVSLAAQSSLSFLDNGHPVLDAHNCYPQGDQAADPLARALSTSRPVGIEQDLAWYQGPDGGKGRPVVTHSAEPTGAEPALRDYFFEQVRPLMEKALAENRRETWPLVIVHFDFKDNRQILHEAVWDMLVEYQDWITTAVKTSDASRLSPFDAKPLLVLTEDNDAQEQVFFTRVPVGEKLLIFGSAHSNPLPATNAPAERARLAATVSPEQMLTERPTNYRRWWNNSWAVVEQGGQGAAAEWTAADADRLSALVGHAHQLGFWIRFYTLNGIDGEPAGGYNFGSRQAARLRWQAAYQAGVDLIATDQYEEFGALLREMAPK